MSHFHILLTFLSNAFFSFLDSLFLPSIVLFMRSCVDEGTILMGAIGLRLILEYKTPWIAVWKAKTGR